MGNWKNYEELEENLSLEELLLVLNAQRKQEKDRQRFLAAIQGIDLSEKVAQDITELSGYDARQVGFGVGLGLGHKIEEVVEV